MGLGRGASGIVIPMVNSAAEMKVILDHALYPPRGRRSFGPFYAPFAARASTAGAAYGSPGEYFKRATASKIAILPMIESKDGLANCEEILSLDGVDGVSIGPADLRLAIGLPVAIDGDEPEFVDALKRIVKTAKRHGKVVGCMGKGEEAARKRALEGMDFVFSTSDYGAMLDGYASDLVKASAGVAKARL